MLFELYRIPCVISTHVQEKIGKALALPIFSKPVNDMGHYVADVSILFRRVIKSSEGFSDLINKMQGQEFMDDYMDRLMQLGDDLSKEK